MVYSVELEERDWLYSLVCINGIGRKTLRRIYETAGSFLGLSMKIVNQLEGLRLSSAVRDALQQKLQPHQVSLDKQQRTAAGLSFTCFLDPAYPSALREMPDPPLLLFYQGNIDLIRQPMFAVVGTRKPTPYGRSVCQYLTTGLSNAGFVIVSGLAHGIDAEAHRAALKTPSKTIAVLGCGIDQIYPRQNLPLYRQIAEEGLILSEYPPGVQPVPGLFPERNRLISGLSRGVLIVEAAERSGSLITVDCALEQGKDVFAVPGPIFSNVSRGPNNLIKQGAKLVTNWEDILEEYPGLAPSALDMPDSLQPSVSAGERQVLELLSYEPLHWDELHGQIDEEKRRELDRHLVLLEAKGFISCLPGGFYVKRRENGYVSSTFDK
ncbi:DNA-processing protein DprA [Brevibacillus sp. B_LB10_24]|uniref:DNA-processing protein DprA n=1 Tax=Brevibacillus sp. B_LB10_24 TaxID=3380645 RepID=UPI0038BB1E32